MCINALYEFQVNRAVGIVIVAGVISGLPQIEQKVVVGLGDEVPVWRNSSVAVKVDWSPSNVRPIAYSSFASCLVLSGSGSLIRVSSFRFCSD